MLVALSVAASLHLQAADAQPPTFQVLSPTPGATLTTLPQIVLSFSEAVIGLEAEDLLINGEPAASVAASGNNVYTFTCSTPLPGFVSVYFDVDHGITDAAGNAFDQSATGASWFYNVADTVPPVMARLGPPPNAVVRSLASAEVVFTEPVRGVTADDLLINGTAATNVVGSAAGPYRFSFPVPAAGTVSFVWANAATIRDQRDNPFAGGSWSVVLNPSAPATISINEFLADNESATGLRDEDNELHDWIELYNHGVAQVNLAGWSIANDASHPRQWVFPPVTLDPGQYLIVFASARNRAGPRLHANFQLSSAGEYLALFSPDEPAVAVSAFNYPEQRIDHSYGVTAAGPRYFSTPTPGSPNGASSLTNIAPPVHFSVERGFFNAPFNLVLATPMSGFAIRYTMDGTAPTVETGLLYTRPLTISNTMPVRAAAFSTNTVPSLVRTHTYIFPEQVVRQSNSPPGFPSSWITQNGSVIVPADYAMDQRVINNAAYSGLARQAITAIPTLSVVMRTSDLFSQANGIYANPRGFGPLWERPASAEFIFPDSTDAIQIDAGYRIQGGSSREENKTHKHSQRLLFRGTYGAGRFEHPLFNDSPVESFDTLVVDAGLNLVWTHRTDATQRRQAQYVRDQFVSDLHNAMGWPAFHGRFFHLYLNGLYWGVHGIHERPEEDFAASYFGGTEEDWDIIKNTTSFEVLSGDLAAWNAMRALANSGVANASQYQQIQQYLDVDSLIDYMILNIYAGNTDWPHHNWYVGRRRNPAGTFKFFSWDAEHVLKSATDNRSTVADANTPAELYDQLRRNSPEFRLRFADHIHKHFFNNGVCTPNQALARYMARIREIDPAIVLESARWGDTAANNERPNQPYERNVEWQAELARLTNSWFPQRSTTVMGQFRGLGLYPTNVAPTFSRHGGRVSRGFNLTMSAPAGTIYFTTNGVDPRVYLAGSPAPDALIYSNAIPLARSAVVKARARVGTTWSALTEAQFTVAQLIVPARITEIMYNPVGGDAFEFIELRNVGDTDIDLSGFSFSGITFVFPEGSLLAPGATLVIASDENPAAFAQRYPGVVVAGYFADRLANGGERIAIKDLAGETITSVDYGDSGQWPALADGSGHSLEIVEPTGDPDDVANWRASLVHGSPGVANPAAASATILINELLAISTSAGSNATYIELHNPGSASVDLSNWSLSDDPNPRKLVFASGTMIEAGEYYVVWLGPGLFLNPEGESVFLFDPATNRIDGLSYGLQVTNYTIGRLGTSWHLCLPTPGADNVGAMLAPASSLSINEWLANTPPGRVDWIELFNASSNAPASLHDVYLAAGGAIHQLRPLSFLPPRGHVQLFADELPGVTHVDFKLPAAGGEVALYDDAGVLLDRVTYSAQTEGVSEGRLPDGASPIRPFPGTASPGAPNYFTAYTGAILNEVMAHNVSGATLSNGLIADWVELHNPSSTPIDLSGMRLAIDALNRLWAFPSGASIGAGSYLVVWCTPQRPASLAIEAELNTGQGIDRQSGGVYLLTAQGQIVDQIEFGSQIGDLSLGRNDGAWRLLATPTPGAANSAPAALGPASALLINEWMPFALNGDDWFEIFNPGVSPVALSGLYVTDNPSIAGLTNHMIAPHTYVDAEGWVRLFADSDVADGRDHVNFRLADFGETLRLYDSNLQFIDSVEFGAVPAQLSEGRLPDGASRIARFSTPSPESANFIPLPHVTVNEVLVNPDAITEQAVELYNSGSQAIDLSHWWLSDSAAFPKKFRVPVGTVLFPGGFHVFYAAQFGAGNTNVPIVWPGGVGEVWLSEGDAAGNLSGARATVSYGPLPFARSYGATPCTGPGFVALRQQTFGIDNPVSVEQFRSGTGAVNSAPGPIEDEGDPPSTPYVVDQPFGRVAVSGSTVLLHVGACGTQPLAHQWYFGDAPLPGKTNAALELQNIQAANAGDYYAIVTNSLGAVTSQVARVSLGALPLITSHPQGLRTNSGAAVTFSVAATGPDLTYQWRFNAVPVPGANGPDFVVPEVAFSDAGHYSVLVSSPAGAIASAAAQLVVTPGLQIFVHPQGRSVLAGSNVLFTVSAQGAGALRYQWFLNGSPIAGATSPSLSVPNAQLDDHGSYFVEVGDENGVVRSATAMLVVRVPPTFVLQPVSMTAIEGDTVTFAAEVNGTPPIGYRWRRNGINLVTKINEPTFTITNVQASHAGTYNVVVTNVANAFPGIISTNATLTVLLRPTLLQPRLLANGAFEATLRGSTGRTHTISRSPDLLNWSDFHTLTSTNSETLITDPTPGSNRFYRARLHQ